MEHLTKQNKRSLSFLRSELLSFYGMENFVDHLKEVGSKAIARSNINRTKRDKQIADITEIGKVIGYLSNIIIMIFPDTKLQCLLEVLGYHAIFLNALPSHPPFYNFIV